MGEEGPRARCQVGGREREPISGEGRETARRERHPKGKNGAFLGERHHWWGNGAGKEKGAFRPLFLTNVLGKAVIPAPH